MHRPQINEGLGLPNLWQYFLAARLTQLSQWFAPIHNIPWKIFESISVSPLHLQGILWSNLNSHCKLNKSNIIVAQFLQLWLKIKDPNKLSSNVPPLASYLGDSRFMQAYNNNNIFSFWILNNPNTLGSFINKSEFPSFTTLQTKYNLPHSEFTHYTQIKQFFSQYYSLSIQTPNTFFEQICINSSRDRGLISQLYRYLNHLTKPDKSGPMLH